MDSAGLFHVITTQHHRMIIRNKRLLAFTMVATSAGTLCSYTHFRNHSFFSHNKHSTANATPAATVVGKTATEKNWFANLIAKRFKSIKQANSLPETTISALLRTNEHSTKDVCKSSETPSAVSGFETNHYRANRELEDRHCECRFNFNDSFMFGVFDGHSGRHCSETLRTRLPLYMSLSLMDKQLRKKFLAKELPSDDIYKHIGVRGKDEFENEAIPGLEEKQERFETGPNALIEGLKLKEGLGSDNVAETLQHTYLTLDKDIAVEAIPDGICNQPIWSGLSGAVAISAYVKDKDLYVSNTGDCRAVLGMQTSDGQWVDEPLSWDHNCENEADVKRLKSQHPKEKMVIFHNRLLGQLQPLRAFGDVPYKWDIDLHRDVLDIIYDYPPVPKTIYLTPPYLTAEPEITHTKLNQNARFLILATDGLWDNVSNSKAVKIVASYLDEVAQGVAVKENAATRLIRYALGRGNNTRLSYMLKLGEHEKRDYHDDITVTVVYFDEKFMGVDSKL